MPSLVGAYLVLFMQAGFALLTCGLVRKKNAAHLVMLTLAAYVFAFLAYYAVGYAFQFGGVAVNASPLNPGSTPALDRFLIGRGHWGFVGGKGFFLNGVPEVPGGYVLALFEVAFMLIAAYILVGAICERIVFWAFVLCQLFVGGILYPVFGCWVWGGGWLSQLGSTPGVARAYVDFAGSSVVHAVGGFSAMALAVILGPRLGKYGPDGSPRPFPAHNIVFVVIGTFILLLGWMGLNPGPSLGTTDFRAVIAVNTNLAAVTGAAAAMFFWNWSFGKPDISMACNGMLAGLVAISASCAFVGPGIACVIGVLAGLLVCAGVLFNERVLKIDDPCGSISVHGYCGWLGAVSVGIFADGSYGAVWNGAGATGPSLGTAGQHVMGLLHGDGRQFVVQLGGASLCALYAFGATYVVFKVVDRLWPMRVEPDVELEGLDLPEFGMLAYPEEEGMP
jgi:Amt family ammonium transporter